MVFHNFVAVDRATFSKAANEREQHKEEVSIETFSATEPTTLNDRRGNDSGAEAVNVAPQGSAEDTEQQEALHSQTRKRERARHSTWHKEPSRVYQKKSSTA